MQHARNPANSVTIGGNNTVFAPVYGPPFIRNLDEGRRYATIEDFRNFAKLVYMLPSLHHAGGTLCEPVDIPVAKRHLDMIYTHIKYSDKPFMASVTAGERSADSVAMAEMVFGKEFVDQNCVMTSLINANSPMVWDGVMLGALKVLARANQACVISPFIVAGAMSPVTTVGTLTQISGRKPRVGIAFTQLCRPGAPVVFGTFAASMSMQSGAPTFGSPEPAMVTFGAAQLARRMGVPFRSGGSLCGSKLPDAQAAYESANTLWSTLLSGVNFCLHAAGWLEGGLASGYEKLIMDADQLSMFQKLAEGVGLLGKRPGAGRHPRSGSRLALPRLRPHPGQFRNRLLALVSLPTTTPSSSGATKARRTSSFAPTTAGSRCSATIRLLPWTQASTSSSRPSWPSARKCSPTT